MNGGEEKKRQKRHWSYEPSTNGTAENNKGQKKQQAKKRKDKKTQGQR